MLPMASIGKSPNKYYSKMHLKIAGVPTLVEQFEGIGEQLGTK
jgi:hypothetical protein